jgi:hypothetical protein
MMPSAVYAFFEARDPPPPFHIPTCQTDLSSFALRISLITHTILSPCSAAWKNAIVRVTAPHNLHCSSSPTARSPGPTPPTSIGWGRFIPERVKATQRTPALTVNSDSDSDSDLTSLSQLSSNRSTPIPAPGLVPKPGGEVGRPGHGGYTLEKAICLSSRTFWAIRVRRTLLSPSCAVNLVSFRIVCTTCVNDILILARASNLKM